MKSKLILFSLLALGGCTPLLMTLYGVKDPKVENEKTLIKKALKFGLDTSNLVSVNGKDFLQVVKKHGIPNAAVYDKTGRYIEYRQTDTACNVGLFQFIPALNTSTRYNQPDSADLLTEWKKFRTLKGNEAAAPAPADFYLLIYWAVWTGKLNKDHVKEWEELAKKNKNCNIKVVKVNLDMQEHWEEQDRERISHAFRKKK